MKKDFWHGSSRGLRIGATGFAIGCIGVGLGFLASNRGMKWLAIVAFCVVALGILWGIVGIAHECIHVYKKRSFRLDEDE